MSANPDQHICPPEHKHGTTLTCVTTHACRCEDCLTARRERAYWRHHMHATGHHDRIITPIPATGVRRRIEALMTLGWSQAAQATRLGVSKTLVYYWAAAEFVLPATHSKIAALFEELALTLPPETNRFERTSAARTRNLARARRYVPPLAWDDIDNDPEPPLPEPIDGYIDEIAIALAISGEHVRLTTAERQSLVARLVPIGRSDPYIAALAGVASKTIERDREHLGLPSHWDEARRRIA